MSNIGRANRFLFGFLIAAFVALMVAAVVLFIAVSANNKKAVSAQALARQIQVERVRNIRTACEAQNTRNRSTIETLDVLIARAPAAQRARAIAGRDSTVLIIDALAPVRDCAAVVREQAPG